MALVRKDAAILVKDVEAKEQLIPTLLKTIKDKQLCERLHNNILTLAQTDSARRIAQEVMKLAKK